MTEQIQRTQWGYATILCRHCKRMARVLLIEKHIREGIGCHRCLRKAATAEEVLELIQQIEQRVALAAARAVEMGGGDAAA